MSQLRWHTGQRAKEAQQSVEATARDTIEEDREKLGELEQHVDAEQPRAPSKLGRRALSLLHHVQRAMPNSIKSRIAPVTARLAPIGRRLAMTKALAPLAKEQEVSRTLHPEAQAALANLLEKDETLRDRLDKAAGYAIFPSVGKASAVLGATYGRGEVFERGRLVGYAALIQLTVGVQVGGDTFTELVIFDKPEALKRFKESKVAFAANAAAVIVKAGVAATRSTPPGADVHVVTEGGLLLEAALGGQKFVFRRAALTRGKSLDLEPASA